PLQRDHPWLGEPHGPLSTSPGLTLPRLPGSRPRCCSQSQLRLPLPLPARGAEASLSRRLHTSPLPATHAAVGYSWQNWRLSQSRDRTAVTSATSCRTSGWFGLPSFTLHREAPPA